MSYFDQIKNKFHALFSSLKEIGLSNMFIPWLSLVVMTLVVVSTTTIKMSSTEICTNPLLILSSPFYIGHELLLPDGLLQNYILFAILVIAFESFCFLGKWRNRLLIFAFAFLASCATTLYTCHYGPMPGAGSSVLAFSMIIMIEIWFLTSKIFSKNVRLVASLILTGIFTWGFLLGSNAREHALGGFFFLVLLFIALLLGFEVPFIKRKEETRK